MTFVAGIGAASAFSSASGGKVYAYNDITGVAGRVVAPANPSRKSVRFHNPGTSDVLIYPSVSQNTGSDTTLTVTNASRGGGFLVYANGGTLEITGECQGEWQAVLAAVGTDQPLTVMDTNV